MNLPAHGSNPQYLFKALNIPLPTNKLDFSANINPLGPPPLLRENWEQLYELVSDYPDPNGYKLKKLLAQREGIEKSQLLLGNGGAEIISLIGRLLANKRVTIIQPTFTEYEEACLINGCKVTYHQLIPDNWELRVEDIKVKLQNSDALWLCNPCNPTGVYYPKSIMIELLIECQKQDCLLIIDEAFYDFLSNYESIVQYIKEYEHLLIIRSMTKMFAIPGLRLGYLMANQSIIEQLSAFQPQWSMSALALKTGEWCLESELYIEETRKLIEMERERLVYFYKEKEFIVSPSCVNFYLVRDHTMTNQMPFFQFLLEKGIIPRHTLNFPGLEGKWLRFAIKAPQHHNKLMEAVTEWRNRR